MAATEQDQLVEKICQSLRTYMPASRMDEYHRVKVRLQKLRVPVLRQILEEDVVHILGAKFLREAVRQ